MWSGRAEPGSARACHRRATLMGRGQFPAANPGFIAEVTLFGLLIGAAAVALVVCVVLPAVGVLVAVILGLVAVLVLLPLLGPPLLLLGLLLWGLFRGRTRGRAG